MHPVPGCVTVEASTLRLRHLFSGCSTNTSTIASWWGDKDSVHRCRRRWSLWCACLGPCPRSGSFLFRVLNLVARGDSACSSPSSSCRWRCSGGIPRPCSPVRHGTQLCKARGGAISRSSIQNPVVVSELSLTQALLNAEGHHAVLVIPWLNATLLRGQLHRAVHLS